jgi:stage III sporulation protein AF
MVFLTKWVMQILVFMLIGTIVELLLPNNQMKKYVNIVLGLLLLLILTQPILFLFSVDVTTVVSKMENTLFEQNQLMEQTKTSMENQKKEIQATQDAYIWNEVASQLKQEANSQLEKRFSIQITDISIDRKEMEDGIGTIICTVTPIGQTTKKPNRTIGPIDIEIGDAGKEANPEPKNVQAIIKELADIWDVETTQIHLQWEGGAT